MTHSPLPQANRRSPSDVLVKAVSRERIAKEYASARGSATRVGGTGAGGRSVAPPRIGKGKWTVGACML